jgi:hypothetical protein
MHTAATRREWVVQNYARIKGQKIPYRQIAYEIKNYFGLDKPVSPATIGRDMAYAEKLQSPNTLTEEAKELLRPENWPEWREQLFGYITSKTQHALYWVMRCLTLKEPIPDWVLEHFELPPDVNADLIEREKLLSFILLMAPRHGKTMTMVHGLIHLYCDNPDLRVIYCQGIASTTEAINALIMIELEHNKQLVDMYGPFRDDDRQWSRQNGFILAKRTHHSITSSFQPVGITSNVRSLDADILIIDDPQDLDRAESEASTSKDYRKITTEFMTRREPHTPMLGVGSHLPTEFGDVWTQIEENLDDIRTEGQDIYINKRPAHHDETCKVWTGEETEHFDCLEWPEYRNWNFLMAQKALLGDELYDAVYQQDARLVGTKPFPPDTVRGTYGDYGIRDSGRSWKIKLDKCTAQIKHPENEALRTCGGELYTCIGFDPARGKSKGSSYTAIAVVQGCIKCNTYYLIDYHFERVSSDAHPDMALSYISSFRPQMIRIEINAYQEALARNRDLVSGAQKMSCVIDEWNTDDKKNTPELGIPMLATSMRTDHFSVPYQTDMDIEYGRELEKSLIRYPKKPNDVPMAIWLAVGGVRLLWEMYADLDPIYLRGRQQNVPAYMLDDPLRVVMAHVGRQDDDAMLVSLE